MYFFQVDHDKIGSGNFFWAFPSKALQKRKNRLEALTSTLASKKRSLESFQSRNTNALEGRRESEERSRKLKRLEDLSAKVAETDAQLKKYSASDPAVIDSKIAAIEFCWNQTNTWIDNVFQIISFTKNKRPEMKDEDILKYMGLPTELDYLPEPKFKPAKKK